jgi:hypothetical protein
MRVFPYLQYKLKVNGHIKKYKDIYLNVYSKSVVDRFTVE